MNAAPSNPVFRALSAAAAGYSVFPIDARNYKPLTPNGANDASTNPDIIAEWWRQWPAAEVGMLPKKPTILASPFVWRDPATIPRREWIYGRHYIRRFISTTIAPGVVGKSSLVLVEALAMATGKPLLGISPKSRNRVWYWNGEDPLEETERRIAAACLHYDLKQADVTGQLFIDSGRNTEIVIATTTRDGTIIAAPLVEALTETIEDNGIDVLTIDPFVSSHRVGGNDNMAIDAVAKTWSKIADRTNCAIELVHHARKTGGAEVVVEDGRGAVALLAGARSARALNGMTKDEAAKAGVERHRTYFRVENGKSNLAPPPETADWFHLCSVSLGNGEPAESNALSKDTSDQVAVVAAWTWPDAFDDVTPAHLRAAQKAVSEGGPWRENNQANDWVGIPIANVLGLNPENKAHKQKVTAILKTWIEKGMFVTVTAKDNRRVSRVFVEVGEWATG